MIASPNLCADVAFCLDCEAAVTRPTVPAAERHRPGYHAAAKPSKKARGTMRGSWKPVWPDCCGRFSSCPCCFWPGPHRPRRDGTNVTTASIITTAIIITDFIIVIHGWNGTIIGPCVASIGITSLLGTLATTFITVDGTVTILGDPNTGLGLITDVRADGMRITVSYITPTVAITGIGSAGTLSMPQA
jgi:hypothetical protein